MQPVEYRDRLIRWADLTVTSNVVTEALFVNCVLDGPALIFANEAVRMDNSHFDLGGAPPDALFVEVAEGTHSLGVVVLNAVAFESCRFQRTSLIGTADVIANARALIIERNGI